MSCFIWYLFKGNGGNYEGEECACGAVNRCVGGTDFACNTDLEDDAEYLDQGYWIHKEQLPVSKVS